MLKILQWKHNNAFCVCIVELHVIFNNIKIRTVAQRCFMTKLCRQQQCKQFATIFKTNYIPANLLSPHKLHMVAEFKQRNVLNNLFYI